MWLHVTNVISISEKLKMGGFRPANPKLDLVFFYISGTCYSPRQNQKTPSRTQSNDLMQNEFYHGKQLTQDYIPVSQIVIRVR